MNSRQRYHLAAFQPKRPKRGGWLKWVLVGWIVVGWLFFACRPHAAELSGAEQIQAAQLQSVSNSKASHARAMEVVDELHHRDVQPVLRGGNGRLGWGGNNLRGRGNRIAEVVCPPMPGDDIAFPWRRLYLCPMLARLDELGRAER